MKLLKTGKIKIKPFSYKDPGQKGFASIEVVVLVVLFFSMLYYSFGFFGVVHTGIIHNIHARTYAFEVFRHRTNLMYFRSNDMDNPKITHYFNLSSRLHGINAKKEKVTGSYQTATERSISMGLNLEEKGRDQNTHSRDIYQITSARNQSVEVNPVWILILYGICFNSQCGD